MNKENLINSTVSNEDQNTFTKNKHYFIFDPKDAFKAIDVDGSCAVDPSQVYSQQVKSRGLRNQTKMMTSKQIQRLQACVKQIATILQEQALTKQDTLEEIEELMLGQIE